MVMAGSVNLVLAPVIIITITTIMVREWAWAMALDGKLNPSFNFLRKGSAYYEHVPQTCLDILFPSLKIF
jgi:hypothetical protein